jgi:release factor glutamine methyltransferase
MFATLDDVRKSLTERFVAAGIDAEDISRELDLLVQHVTGWSAAEQHLHDGEPLEEDQLMAIEEIAEQREIRVPLQYCLEEAWFMGLKFNVRPGVLIPRADTETLVETALKFLEPIENPWVLDVGTGSGAIAISMAKLRPTMRVIALDISDKALRIALENARLHGVSERIQFVKTDWLTQEPSQKFDALISNPPYIPTSLATTLAPEVRMHEPKEALFGLDEDGLGFYRNLSQTAPEHLGSGGFIAVEIGHGQADAVREIFAHEPWRNLEVHYDLNKIPRVISALCP